MHKGWFKLRGVQDGDRTVTEQLTGLGAVCRHAFGKTVLDLGCAEGLIGLHMLNRCGASMVHGLSIVKTEIAAARELAKSALGPAKFFHADLNGFAKIASANPPLLLAKYDVVLLLSILHKLKNPEDILNRVLKYAAGTVAIRLPRPVIIDVRSGNRRFDVRAHMQKTHALIEEPQGPRDEWMGVFEPKIAETQQEAALWLIKDKHETV
jgi:SAM-dependent methyltransferase